MATASNSTALASAHAAPDGASRRPGPIDTAQAIVLDPTAAATASASEDSSPPATERAPPLVANAAQRSRPEPPTQPNVWDFQREQRRQAARPSFKDDVGYHRPTMAQLKPVLDLIAAGHATGGDIFDAYAPLRRDSDRPIVGYVRLVTGSNTNQIDEGKALKAALADLQSKGLGTSLADLVQIRKDLANQQLTLGFATFDALDKIIGMSLKIPVKDTFMTFTAESSHAMDGFHLDILDFAHDRTAECLRPGLRPSHPHVRQRSCTPLRPP
jgi:hypothetical protein